MHKIVVGFIRSPEGEAALNKAIDEAKLRDAQLIVVHSMYGGKREDETEVLAYRQELEAVELDAQRYPRKRIGIEIKHEAA